MSRRRPARELLPLRGIAGDALLLSGGGLRAILDCPTLAFGIKGEAEQRAVVEGWAALLNSLAHPIEIVIRTRDLDPSTLATRDTSYDGGRKALGLSYRRRLDTLDDEESPSDEAPVAGEGADEPAV